jgi:hypothetical protein
MDARLKEAAKGAQWGRRQDLTRQWTMVAAVVGLG